MRLSGLERSQLHGRDMWSAERVQFFKCSEKRKETFKCRGWISVFKMDFEIVVEMDFETR